MLQAKQPLVAVLLAAGQGTRMRSSLPKVLHPIAGRPMLEWVLRAAREAGCERFLVVIGHGAEQVRDVAAGDDVTFVVQQDQRGTGHALAQVEPYVEGSAIMLVLSADVPLVAPSTLGRLAALGEGDWGAMAVADADDPGSLGRVLASANGGLERIVEAVDATAEELEIRQVNAGLYVLPAPETFAYLRQLKPDNAKGEFYLTDALTAAARQGRRVALFELEDPLEALGVNDRQDLVRVHRELLRRKSAQLMAAGVTILDPERTVIEVEVVVGTDTVIHPGVHLAGHTRIGCHSVLHQGVCLRDSIVGDRVVIEPYSVLEGAEIGDGGRIGPFARLRPGTVTLEGAKVGNFVEVKNALLGEGVKANHLSYIGDATVGEGTNIGAGVVTCNYDGRRKHRTEIGRRALIGSDTMLVAPVAVGDDAMTAAGSVVSKDVPAGALAVERTSQRNIAGWVKRFLRKRG